MLRTRSRRRRAWRAGLAVVGICVIAIGGSYAVMQSMDAEATRQQQVTEARR